MDVPVHVGFSILQYAKLRMLEFYFDFMLRYVESEYVRVIQDSVNYKFSTL